MRVICVCLEIQYQCIHIDVCTHIFYFMVIKLLRHLCTELIVCALRARLCWGALSFHSPLMHPEK